MSLKSRFIKHLQTQYPDWNSPENTILLHQSISEQLLSEKIVELPENIYMDICEQILNYQQLKIWSQQAYKNAYEKHQLATSENEGACTSFDFHITPEGKLKLIEINTNASFLALGLELYQMQQLPTAPNSSFTKKDLVEMFKIDARLVDHNLKKIFILDEKPEQQRLFIEFLLFQKIFKTESIESEIIDISDINKLPSKSFIYNRYTDFYLSLKQSEHIKTRYNSKEIFLSPHPYEYFLLADKQRMLDWQNQTEIPIPSSLLKIYDLGKTEKDFIWSERKQLFFKPKNSFGSKQAYKGASISRRLFDEFYGENMIAQEYATPSEVDVLIDHELKKMKYDLRCYAYHGKLQMVIARIYQGQTTNLQTKGGGFAVVKWNKSNH